MNGVRGYKVFNPDWTCRGKQYSCPGAFEEDVKLNKKITVIEVEKYE